LNVIIQDCQADIVIMRDAGLLRLARPFIDGLAGVITLVRNPSERALRFGALPSLGQTEALLMDATTGIRTTIPNCGGIDRCGISTGGVAGIKGERSSQSSGDSSENREKGEDVRHDGSLRQE
jgi:hypothetical protein